MKHFQRIVLFFSFLLFAHEAGTGIKFLSNCTHDDFFFENFRNIIIPTAHYFAFALLTLSALIFDFIAVLKKPKAERRQYQIRKTEEKLAKLKDEHKAP